MTCRDRKPGGRLLIFVLARSAFGDACRGHRSRSAAPSTPCSSPVSSLVPRQPGLLAEQAQAVVIELAFADNAPPRAQPRVAAVPSAKELIWGRWSRPPRTPH